MADIQVTYTERNLWPTKLGVFEFAQDDPINEELKQLVYAEINPCEGGKLSHFERRLHGLFERSEPCVVELKRRILECARIYLGEASKPYYSDIELDGRAVLIEDRAFFNTHVDIAEADIVCTYFPTGEPTSDEVNALGNPQWVLEDPSRYLSEPRLPFEDRHSHYIAPRPGLLMLFPGHIPHNQHPYDGRGRDPHIQIVGNLRLNYIKGYRANHG